MPEAGKRGISWHISSPVGQNNHRLKSTTMPQLVHPARVISLSRGKPSQGPVVYWMSREQRVRDNWALLFAAEQAQTRMVPLAVAFCLAPAFLGATLRQYGFMLKGLAGVQASLSDHNIPFYLCRGEVVPSLLDFLDKVQAGLLVTDFDPLRIKRQWKADLMSRVDIPVFEVDAHNIVPCREASAKQEYAARTIRPKIHRRLDVFLTDFPALPEFSEPPLPAPPVNWEAARTGLGVNMDVAEVKWLEPGETGAHKMLRDFLEHRLDRYLQRNDPNVPVLSNLSPYLHFGQISAQRVAWDVLRSNKAATSREAFLEELIVRRELADNFCWYNQAYDTMDGFPDWAKNTLNKHRGDKREYLYDLGALESAETHDPLWNAAQMEMVRTGKMHGYMRMYWAKKILEWTPAPEEAMAIAVRLNDTYELDGRDPNGYTGIAWSIGGVHDRPWFERPVFGQVRFMSASGCARKFDVQEYIQRIQKQTSSRETHPE
jgi:deoxyribodipyrimidine photo-lyase